MMKFFGSPESNLELEVTSFEVLSITDYNNGNCSVLVQLTNTDIRATWVHNYPDFEYQNDTWTTQDILNFVNSRLTV